MRVFVALDLPDEVRAALGELIRALEATCRGARWARVAGMHVTLRFIGEVTPEKVEKIQSQLATVRSPSDVEMNFRGVGFFPNERHPRVFWAGIEATPNLSGLAADIERRMETLGIPGEPRAFKPHLTLARFKSEDGLARLREALAGRGPLEFGRACAGEFHLYQSRLKPGGAEYTRIATFPFAGDAP